MYSVISGNSAINFCFASLLLSLLSYWTSMAFTSFDFLKRIGQITFTVTNLVLFIYISLRWINSGHFPLSNLYESLLFLTWGLTTISLILEKKTHSAIIGSLISPVATFIIAFASLSLPPDMQKASPLVPALKSNWLMMHVSIMMVSYAVLIVGSLLSILFLVLTWGEKISLEKNILNPNARSYNTSSTKSLSAPYSDNKLRLLNNIDNLSYQTISLGFPLLTIGILAGAVWANEAWGSYWSWDPKETWALITWLVFAAYLHSRITKGWTGKKSAILASVGFIVVWICYLGVNFLGQGLHSYGWIS